MAVTITSSQVKADFPTDVNDTEIDMLIAFINGADVCLDLNTVAANTVTALKLYAVRHMLTMQAGAGRGTVRSEGAPSGASRAFNARQNTSGSLLESSYGSLLKQMDVFGCVTNLMGNTARVDLMSVGG